VPLSDICNLELTTTQSTHVEAAATRHFDSVEHLFLAVMGSVIVRCVLMNARSRGALKSQSRKMFPRSYRLSLSKTWSQVRAFTHVLIVVLAASPDFMLLFLSDLLGASTSVFCASSTLCQTPIGTKRIPLFCVACQKPLWVILEDNRLKNVQRRNMQMSLGLQTFIDEQTHVTHFQSIESSSSDSHTPS
jgi:hypothetical protein